MIKINLEFLERFGLPVLYRLFVASFLILLLLVDLFFKNLDNTFRLGILLVLLIFGIADSFSLIKIPGVVELKKEIKEDNQKINEKLEKIIINQQTISPSQSTIVNTAPMNMPSQPAETRTLPSESEKKIS